MTDSLEFLDPLPFLHLVYNLTGILNNELLFSVCWIDSNLIDSPPFTIEILGLKSSGFILLIKSDL